MHWRSEWLVNEAKNTTMPPPPLHTHTSQGHRTSLVRKVVHTYSGIMCLHPIGQLCSIGYILLVWPRLSKPWPDPEWNWWAFESLHKHLQATFPQNRSHGPGPNSLQRKKKRFWGLKNGRLRPHQTTQWSECTMVLRFYKGRRFTIYVYNLLTLA